MRVLDELIHRPRGGPSDFLQLRTTDESIQLRDCDNNVHRMTGTSLGSLRSPEVAFSGKNR